MTDSFNGPAGASQQLDPHQLVSPDRDEKEAHTWHEIERLLAEAHARLPRDRAQAIGALYARYSTRFQDSIADQVRTILADAMAKQVFIPLEHVFVDMGVRGAKSDREGLNGLRGCLNAKAVSAVFFFATNRLFRKLYKSLQFVEEQIVERGIRAVFVKSNVDTADEKRWRAFHSMNAMMDEFVVSMNVDNIRAAHEGLLEKWLVFGTVSFGYKGEPVEGPLTRRGRPRRALAIDPIAADWVRNVFRWFVVDRVPIGGIVRRLNADPTVPPPPKSTKGCWTRLSVLRLLRNPRYRGSWPYGNTETVWVSSKDYARQVPRQEPLKVEQIESLRLVPDDQWFEAQALIETGVAKVAGRKPRDGDTTSRPRMLKGLFVCPVHKKPLYVAGAMGKYMVCQDCRNLRNDQRTLYSHLSRKLALRRTCETLAELIRGDTELVTHVIAACQKAAGEAQAPDPARLERAAACLAKLDQRIAFVMRNPGDTPQDQAESGKHLQQLRKERATAQADHRSIQAAASRVVTIPTEDEVRALVSKLAETLCSAANGVAPEEAGCVRAVIDLVTGGRIELVQMGERKAQRGWLRGRFRCHLVDAVVRRATGSNLGPTDDTGGEVEIDYLEDRPGVPAADAAVVIELYQADVLQKVIVKRTGLSRSTVLRILADWHEQAGVPHQDGRSRRSRLAVKHLVPPDYQQLADQVKELADEDLLFDEIAERLSIDRNTVTSAWKHWHASRGLPVPDGRARRKSLRQKSR